MLPVLILCWCWEVIRHGAQTRCLKHRYNVVNVYRAADHRHEARTLCSHKGKGQDRTTLSTGLEQLTDSILEMLKSCKYDVSHVVMVFRSFCQVHA
jgi:hypothetical protein